MKRIFPLLFASVLLSSCLDTQSHYTPEISLSSAFTTAGDTLLYRYDELSNLWHLDTLHVGDTLKFSVGYAALGNNIISTHLSWDTAYVDLWSEFTAEMLSIMLSESDTAKLDLYLPTGYNYVGLPIWCVAKKAGNTPLKFTVNTDSKYSPATETLVLDIEKE